MEEDNNKSKSTAKSVKEKSSSSKKTSNVNKRLKKDTKEKLMNSKNEEIIIENIQPIEKEVEKKTKKQNSLFSKSKLKIIPLGGLNEIGKNLKRIINRCK